VPFRIRRADAAMEVRGATHVHINVALREQSRNGGCTHVLYVGVRHLGPHKYSDLSNDVGSRGLERLAPVEVYVFHGGRHSPCAGRPRPLKIARSGRRRACRSAVLARVGGAHLRCSVRVFRARVERGYSDRCALADLSRHWC
jgi:hypothetical protein